MLMFLYNIFNILFKKYMASKPEKKSYDKRETI